MSALQTIADKLSSRSHRALNSDTEAYNGISREPTDASLRGGEKTANQVKLVICCVSSFDINLISRPPLYWFSTLAFPHSDFQRIKHSPKKLRTTNAFFFAMISITALMPRKHLGSMELTFLVDIRSSGQRQTGKVQNASLEDVLRKLIKYLGIIVSLLRGR